MEEKEKETNRILSQHRMTKLLQIKAQLVEVSRTGTAQSRALIDDYIAVTEELDRLIIAEAKIQEETM